MFSYSNCESTLLDYQWNIYKWLQCKIAFWVKYEDIKTYILKE
jgi:hypothetical protein